MRSQMGPLSIDADDATMRAALPVMELQMWLHGIVLIYFDLLAPLLRAAAG